MRYVLRSSAVRSQRRNALTRLSASLLFASAAFAVETEVVGGSATSEHPAVAAILYPSGELLCSGFLVSPSCLVTAAHCIVDLDPLHTAYFGDAITEPFAAKVNLTGSSIVHPSYDGGLDYDLALISLVSQPGIAPLPTAAAPAAADPVRIVGFGTDLVTGDGAKLAAEVVVDSATATLLALDGAGGNACFGDSGGPMLEEADGVYRAVGVMAAGGNGCADGTFGPRLDAHAEFVAVAIAELCGQTAVGNGIFLQGFEPDYSGWTGWPTSCVGRCDNFDPQAGCQCDSECLTFGDCCDDACDLCGHC